MNSFADFRSAVLAGASAAMRQTSTTPTPHFIVDDEFGQLSLFGPIFQTEKEKAAAPKVMAAWIARARPERLAFVMEAFSVANPSKDEIEQPASMNPRRRHRINVWIFRKGSREIECWSAPVQRLDSGSIAPGEWSKLDTTNLTPSGVLFDPILRAMAELR